MPNWRPLDQGEDPVITGDPSIRTAWTPVGPGSGGEVPAGGSADQVLSKIDGTNYNTEWSTPSGGGSADPALTIAYGFLLGGM